MSALFEVATVLRGDGEWTIGYPIDALSCGRHIEVVDICTPATIDDPDIAGTGYEITPFAVTAFQKFPTRCQPSEAAAALEIAMERASEYEIAHALWYGDMENWDSNMFFTNADIHTKSPGANPSATIADVLKEAYDRNPDLAPVLHLGIGSAAGIGSWDFLANFDAEVVVSAAYPLDAVAVSGPMVVRLGSIEGLSKTDTSVNRNNITATRLAAIEFDPCLVVRAG